MGKDVIIACDFDSREETLAFLEKFGDERPFIKIGMELFYAEGNDMVNELKERGHKIFLDLKMHDIPNTVKKAMKVIGRLNIDMCNIHAMGTVEMMKAALEGLEESSSDSTMPMLIAVTQLTSTSQEQMNNDLLIDGYMKDVVSQYAGNVKRAGLDGVVCSPMEAEGVHNKCGYDFLTVSPGVRLEGDSKDDQARVTTPAKAKQNGADYIVVGRSITRAADPVEAYKRCLEEFL